MNNDNNTINEVIKIIANMTGLLRTSNLINLNGKLVHIYPEHFADKMNEYLDVLIDTMYQKEE